MYELDEDGNRIRDQNGEYVFNAVPTTDWGSPETVSYTHLLMRSEVAAYDSYLRGECYGFELYKNGELSDSCWGCLLYTSIYQRKIGLF